jgi:hypothetical protein
MKYRSCNVFVKLIDVYPYKMKCLHTLERGGSSVISSGLAGYVWIFIA